MQHNNMVDGGKERKCCKSILFTSNFLFWLIGLTLIAISLTFLLDSKAKLFQSLAGQMSSTLEYACYANIGIGACIAFIGVCGCCGIIKEGVGLLVWYMILLFMILFSQISISILIGHKKALAEERIGSQFWSLMQAYPLGLSNTTNDSVKAYVDRFQYEIMQCCGVNGSSDWMSTEWYRSQERFFKYQVPPSCCNNIALPNYDLTEYQKCAYAPGSLLGLRFDTGCVQKLENWVESNYFTIVTFTSIATVIEFIGIFLTFCFCLGIRKETIERRYA